MKTSSKERTLQWINEQYSRGIISFSHKLQRPIGQWNPKMRSLLIHSLLVGFPVNPIYVVEQDGTIYTLDGSQRTSTCIEYLENKFSLTKDIPDISITVKEDGKQVTKNYPIAGKKFKKLDEEVQRLLLSCQLEFCTLSDYTDEDVREMFRRQNSGKSLNGKQLRITKQSDHFSSLVFELANHPFMDKLMTKAQRKNGTDRDIIIQTFMLIQTNQNEDYTSFRSKDIDTFVTDHSDSIPEDKVNSLRESMDKFNATFESELKVAVTSIPMMLFSGYRVTKDKKSFTKLVDIINEFLSGYETNEDYKQFVMSGTSSSENVRGRFDWWRNSIKMI